MKVEQAATVLNAVFGGLVGESAVLAADMSNIVDFGRYITTSSTFENDLNTYAKAIWDKVGQTIYNNVEYKGSAPDIYATSAEYGSVLEKIRIIASEYAENEAWTTTINGGSSHEEMFGYHPADVEAKYFNKLVTYRTEPVTVTYKQLKSAFESQLDMMRFIGMLEQAYISKIRIAFDMLIKLTINTFMAHKINKGNGVINLLTMYKAATGDTTLTTATALADTNFLRYSTAIMDMYRDFLTEPTALYNTDGYVNYSKRDDLKTIMLSDFARAVESRVYSTSYHDNYVRLTDYDVVSRWQGSGTTNDFATRSSINITIDNDGTPVTVNQSGIVGLVFDKRACMINAYETEVGVAHNNFDKWDNYVWLQQAGYFVDAGENGIVFIIADAS